MSSPKRMTAVLLAALLALPLAAVARTPTEPWLVAIPAAGRASLEAALRSLLAAEAGQDWAAIYHLRPSLDRETETEEQFVRRWKEMAPDPVFDFEPRRTDTSLFAGVSAGEQVFDIQGCVQLEKGSQMGEEGSISAHLEDGHWSLDGVHLLTDAVDKPEPCRFHTDRGLLASAHRR